MRSPSPRPTAPILAAVFALALPGADARGESGFAFESVVERARELARSEHVDRLLPLEGDYARLDYDQYRDIRFDTERPVWRDNDSRFRLDLLPSGFYFDRPVEINVVENGAVRKIDYANDWFTFGPLVKPPANPEELDFSGFRLRTPINRPDVLDEFVVFQGASYFRAVARAQLYGLSARALAIDTATERGEEFPRFTTFWIHAPEIDATAVVVDALLESPSVTGAYRFTVTPGEETRMDVESVLFARRDAAVLGIAPLTSMFLYDGSNRERFDDYRDAVHDSDGLQMINGAEERVWRSLANPRELQVSAFVDESPAGFGLVQRHRDFVDFEDAEARYERRPSAWVEPKGDWGEGSVQLVEIPTDKEFNDNVVAFWRPSEGLERGREYRYAYRLLWTDRPADELPLMRVSDVRIGRHTIREDTLEVVVDFIADEGTGVGSDELEPVVQASSGEVGGASVLSLAEVSGEARYRVHFDFRPGEVTLSEWRLRLLDGGVPASETWLYRWTR